MLFSKNKALKLFSNITVFMISIILCLVLYYLTSTMNFMDKIKISDYQTENYHIVVLKESEYAKLKDLENETIGVLNKKNASFDEAYQKLTKKIDFKKTNYEDLLKLGKDLLNKKSDALFISESYLSLINDQIENFENNTKILETISIKVKNEVKTKDVDVTKETFNIYISGIDVYGDITSVSRSDVNMIMTINPKTNKILLTSIPRDYYVRLHGTTGYKDKLTHSGIYGIDMTVNTIEDLLDIDINYYVRVNFTTVIELVDAIGGVDIYSDKSFTAHTNKSCKFVEGTNHLDGACALAFSRERFAYKEGDRHRVQNQQAVLTAIINKMTSSTTIITKYNSILKTLGNSFQTSIPTNKIYSLINMQLDTMPSWDIEQISLDGTNSYNYTYSYSSGKLYVMEPDINTIYKAQQKIEETAN